jgi:hypothetical protein
MTQSIVNKSLFRKISDDAYLMLHTFETAITYPFYSYENQERLELLSLALGFGKNGYIL